MINLTFNHKKSVVVFLCLSVFFLSAVMSQAESFPYVTPLRWSPDGTKVTVTINDVVEVWDATTEQVLHLLRGHTDHISAVAWSPDNTLIATSSYDQTVKLWNANNGTLLHTLLGHNASVSAIAWSTDGTRLLSWGFDTRPNLFVWDVASGTLLERHDSGDIVAAAFSPDGRRLALSASLGIGTIDAQSFEVLSGSPRVPCCPNTMYSIAWSPDGSTLITGSISGLVTLWDADTAQMLRQFVANPHYAPDSRDVDNLALSWVRDVAFAPDGSIVLAISGDGTLREWSAVTGDLLQEMQIASLYAATWSPYAGRLAVLGPNPQEAATLSSELDFDAADVTGGAVHIVVPAPSLERLQAIADACNAPIAVEQSLTASLQADLLSSFIAQVEALPENAIPPACAADLIAVAEALQSR